MRSSNKRILVPVNSKPASAHAFRWACQMSKQIKADLYAIYVFEVPLELALNSETMHEDIYGEEVLSHIEAIALEEKCRLHPGLLQARHAGTAIVLEAEERHMDLIVLGITLRQRFEPNILGATTNYVLKHAPCEVILSRERVPVAALSRV